jgi:hypothetical protein
MDIVLSPLNRRSAPAEQAPIPELDAAEQRTFLLAEWANRDACRAHFMPFLDALIEDANELISANVASHPLAAYAIGSRDALRGLRGHFQHWAGTAE